MLETLSDAIDALSTPERGFHFTSADSPVSFLDFRKLRADVQSLARKLRALGNQRGEPVVIVLPDQAEFVQGFLAIIRAGLVAVPVYPPPLIGSLDNYIADVARIKKITGARCMLTSDGLIKRLQATGVADGVVSWSELSSCSESAELPPIQPSDVALVQFTSGSTGSPKGVELTHSNLVTNAMAIKQALAIDPARDQGVSWLPLHHDMGLIGFLITPLLSQASTWYLPPLEFARRPQRWLDLMSETGATVSYAPNFGYDLVTRRVKSAEIEKLDLSAWRVAGCGGEAIIPRVLNRFAHQLQSAGFDKAAFVPSYGLAEATVAVSISPLQRGVATKSHPGSHSGSLPGGNEPDGCLVSSGQLIADTEVQIVSSSADILSDGSEGEIQVRGPGVAKRFWNESGHSSACSSDGWLSTGDLGVLKNGELHICGRIKETVQLNGRNYYPHDIEECAQGLDGVKRGGVVAFGRPGAGSEQLVLVAETSPTNDAVALQRNLRASVRKRLGLSVADVVIVGRGVISRTTSGKIQRSALRARYLSFELNNTSERAEC